MLYSYEHKVTAEEIDVFKVVHFSNYFKWCSTALIEFFSSNGLGAGVFDNGKTEIRMGRVSAVYSKSAFYQDKININIEKLKNQRNSIEVLFKVKRENEALVKMKLTVAFVDSIEKKLVSVPKSVLSLA